MEVPMKALRSFNQTVNRQRQRRREGEPFEAVDEAQAQDYERMGHATRTGAKMAAKPLNKMAPSHEGKSPAGGEARQSSALPPAPASRRVTVKPSGNGRRTRGKKGTR